MRSRSHRSSRALAFGLALVALTLLAGAASARPDPSRFRPRSACPTVFPASNVWNKRVDTLPVRTDSAALIAFMGANVGVHPDFGTYAGYGIPINAVTALTPRSAVTFQWPGESDAGPYPIPASPKIEGNGPIDSTSGDRHILMVDRTACRLWELYAARRVTTWSAGSGAIWDLTLERPATRRLDLRRRRRPADLPGPRPIRRGRRGGDRPCPPLHGSGDPDRRPPLPGPP